MTDQGFIRSLPVRLDPQQEAAVLGTEGPALLLAVPGSGKTTVLVARLGYLIQCRGVDPRQILTVTYTVAAAGDMRRRFLELFGGRLEAPPFRTINGLCASIIDRYAARRGTVPFQLAGSEGRLDAVLRDLLVRTGTARPTEQQIRDARTQITYCKNMLLTEEEIHGRQVEGMDFPAVYFEYQDFLRRSRLMDYDDQMVFALRILRRDPELLAWYQRRYRYLCLDEAQDTSKIQHVILALLAQAHRELFLVGDEDQSIYGFRAAWPQALLDFGKNWPGAKVLLMETNYRSGGALVEAADAFIQRNRERHPKHMRASRPAGEGPHRVVLADYGAQYPYLLEIARDCRRSTAVLYRNNDSALPLIDLLEREGVPYACRQREGFFFTNHLVRDLTDILRFALGPTDGERFLGFYYKLDLKIKKQVLAGLLRRQKPGETVFQALLGSGGLEPWQAGKVRAMETHFSKLPGLTSFAALQRIVKYMGYGEYLKGQKLDASRLDVLLSLARQTPRPEAFLARLDWLRQRLAQGSGGEEGCPFVLSTIHGSKGLEFDRVVMIDVVDGIFPADLSAGREALEEERRLFYVGATRARERLDLIVYENKFGAPREAGTSFVSQLVGEEEGRPAEAAPAGQAGAERLAPGWEVDLGPGTPVVHRSFGPGVVRSLTGTIAEVDFETAGRRRVDLSACLKKGLLRRR